MNLCGRIEISEDGVLTLEPPEEEPPMISRSRSFASSAESRTVVGVGLHSVQGGPKSRGIAAK